MTKPLLVLAVMLTVPMLGYASPNPSPNTNQDDPLNPLASSQLPAVEATQDAAPDGDLNTNHRYLVESVAVTGEVPKQRLSLPLQSELDRWVGRNFDSGALGGLADRIKDDLSVPNVDMQVRRGGMPEHVVVTFVVGERPDNGFDLDLARFLYHSKQGWTGEGNARIRFQGNALSFGLVSDGDRLAERYAGLQAGYERASLGTDRVGLRFRFLSYHQQWNMTTRLAAAPDELYRSRQHFIPEVRVLIAEPLELNAGVDFARYRIAAPGPVGFNAVERTESSNAVVSTLRYHQRWDSDFADREQEFTASYGVRAGTGLLESDRRFLRHQGQASYRLEQGNNEVEVKFLAGRIGGSAPLFERFILGNAELLRGWNKFDLAPLGGSRAVHGSIDYHYRGLLLFYDTGALWDRPEQREQKQSAGFGFGVRGWELALAWPIRSGAANPVFYVGMNF